MQGLIDDRYDTIGPSTNLRELGRFKQFNLLAYHDVWLDKDIGQKTEAIRVIVATINNEGFELEAGRLSFFASSGYVSWVEVEPEYRRMGLATAMWTAAEKEWSTLLKSDAATDEGKAFLASTGINLKSIQ